MSLSRVQRKTLSHMRQLIRHVQTRVRSADPHGAAVWRKHIVQQYRANQSVSSKAEARQLRRAAADKLALLQAVDEEQVRRWWRHAVGSCTGVVPASHSTVGACVTSVRRDLWCVGTDLVPHVQWHRHGLVAVHQGISTPGWPGDACPEVIGGLVGSLQALQLLSSVCVVVDGTRVTLR